MMKVRLKSGKNIMILTNVTAIKADAYSKEISFYEEDNTLWCSQVKDIKILSRILTCCFENDKVDLTEYPELDFNSYANNTEDKSYNASKQSDFTKNFL